MTVIDFGTRTLPYGVFRPPGLPPRVGVAVGELVLDLTHLIGSPDEFAQPSLNAFLTTGPERWKEVRSLVAARAVNGVTADEIGVYTQRDVEILLPVEVADFVDFFSGIEHAVNMGRILRPGDANPLKPNYRHLPVGYHGRAGTVIPSGAGIVRPSGQIQAPQAVVCRPTERLDIEAELGYVVGVPSVLGRPVSTGEFRDHVFGMVVLIDWSARDIQAWEYQPLGPFLAKSFATTISSWVVPLAALDDSVWVDGPAQEPGVLPYLRVDEPRNPAVRLEVQLNGRVLTRPDSGRLYWSPAQQLAHMTRNGASLRTGDLFGTGTISSYEPEGMGSLMEISWGGTRPIDLGEDGIRSFLDDGDEIVLRATAGRDASLPLGEARAVILPAAAC
ncbi:fumarylacetoacetate hydrolase family protein [Streptomyces sp. NPDC008137]|uniref:fumarylacetoacetate hydrolase family protein n=1 Tax=Streptomyces sp. NPDC008137 TaxID=3364813 RepID=UPI0036E30034